MDGRVEKRKEDGLEEGRGEGMRNGKSITIGACEFRISLK